MRAHLVDMDRADNSTHWANACRALQRSAALPAVRTGTWTLEPDPARADVILFCGTLRQETWPMALWRHPVFKAWPRKAVRVSTADREIAWLPGLYTSASTRGSGAGVQGGLYPHVTFVPWLPDAPALSPRPGGDTPWLFSFVGAVKNHPVRTVLARINDPDGLFHDASAHPGLRAGADKAVYDQYHRQYVDSLRCSRFVLCPRGIAPASIRVFETLRAARVPVILSDVGANHPVRFSNTFRLYIEGWTGVTIDGNPDVVALHRRMRPLDTAICAVVSNAVQRVPFICHEVDCLSRIATASEPTDGRVGMVVTQTLDEILSGAGWQEGGYDLLNIDVEGHEQEVLQGVDLKRFRPRVIAVEIHGMDLTAPHRSALVEWLMREGYALDSYCRPTAIFVERGCR